MRRLNVKLVVILAAVSLVSIVLVAGVHAWQMKRTAGVLLYQAREAEKEEEWEKAVSFYSQYVEYVPEDAEEAAHMALLMADMAEKPDASKQIKWKAYNALETTLRHHIQRDDVRRRLVDYTILVGRWGDAIEHIQFLLKANPNDVELQTKLGTCQFALDRNREAEETLSKAISQDPHQVDAYSLLAVVLRERLGKPEDADKVIDQLVEQNPDSAKARIDRVRYLQQFYRETKGLDYSKQKAQWKEDLKKALELDGENADALLLAAYAALQEEKYEEARRHLEHGKKLHPNDERIVQQLVMLDVREKKFDDVASLLKEGPKTAKTQQMEFEVKLHQGDVDGARKILSTAEKDKDSSPAMVEYMRAYLDFIDMKWLEASKEFERLRPSFPESGPQIDMMLGHCYEMLGESDRQFEAYQRAVSDSPNNVPAHVGLARAMMTVGQHERALTELRAVKRALGPEEFVQSGPARGALLSLLLMHNSRLPEAERDWQEIDELAAATAKAFPDSKEVLLVESTIREQKGDRAAAREMLQAAVEKDPTDAAVWLSLLRLEFLDNGPQAALKMLDTAVAKAGDVLQLRQARVSYSTQLPAAEAKPVLEAAAAGLDKFKEDEQDRLQRLLGVAYFRADDMAGARAMWSKVAERNPNDPVAQFTLFDIGVREENDAAIDASVKSIQRLFGSSSPEAKLVEARRLVAQVREKRSGDSKETLAKARQLLRRAAEQRPRWAVLARFEAEIDVLDGRIDDAIVHLQRAFDLGDSDAMTARQIAQLLVSRGRGEEASKYLEMANAKGGGGGDAASSESLDVSIALAENDIPKAVKLLETAHERDPDNERTIITLGQLLPNLGREDEAEKLLRNLVEKKPDLPLAWYELVRFLVKQRRPDDARTVIAEAQEKLPKDQANLAIGQCFDALGEPESAEKYFIQARDEKPDDLGLTRALASFYQRTKNTEKARAELERLLKAKAADDTDLEHISWANRELALVIASGGEYRDFQQALSQLRPAAGKTATLADKLMLARLLASRPEADSRMEATRILESVKADTTLPVEGQFILAKLYDGTGNWAKCREEMLSVLGKAKDNPTFVASFIEMLLRHDDLEAAKFWMARMEQIAPAAILTAALKARILVREDKPEEAVAALRSVLPRPMPRERLGTLLEVAKLLEDLKQYDAADSMFREYGALEPKAILVLAGFVGRHGELKDALSLCERGFDLQASDQVVRAALSILRLKSTEASKEDFSRVEAWVNRAIARNPKDLVLKLERAELLDLQGRYNELEEVYAKMLQDPEVTGVQRALVLNNLAYLLAVQNKVGDSRKLIDEAVQILGPQSDLLDTRALVHLAHGEVKQALDDLQMSLVDQPSGTKYFHLARAWSANKDSQAAQEALKKAIDSYGLKEADLPRLEQAAFKQLTEQFGVN